MTAIYELKEFRQGLEVGQVVFYEEPGESSILVQLTGEENSFEWLGRVMGSNEVRLFNTSFMYPHEIKVSETEWLDPFKLWTASVRRTMSPDSMKSLANYALGLGGEAGEVQELLKKHIFHDKKLDLHNLKLELGDVLWYLTAIALQNGLGLQDIMQANEEKLKNRYPNGFPANIKGKE